MVMAPVPPERAARDAESSRTAQVADAQLRTQGGFLQTARQRRQSEALEGRETELADGRGAFLLAGYVTVSGADKPALEEASSELERAAGRGQTLPAPALWPAEGGPRLGAAFWPRRLRCRAAT